MQPTSAIKNFDEFESFVRARTTEELMAWREKNYDHELFYREYREGRFKVLKRDGMWTKYIVMRYVTPSKTMEKIIRFFLSLRKSRPDLSNFPPGYFGGRPLEWTFNHNTITLWDPEPKAAIKDLKEHIADYADVYRSLADELSKRTLFIVLLARLTGDQSLYIRNEVYDSRTAACFDQGLIPKNIRVGVDCGAFNGDTLKEFHATYREYKMIYGFEPDRNIFPELEKNTSAYRNIKLIPAAVLDKKGTVTFDGPGGGKFSDTGNEVPTVTIDDEITEPIDFLKMDIEGSELPALHGAERHIKNDRPFLAINAYHRIDDIWKCFAYLKSLNPNYAFYLRHYNPSYIKDVLYAKEKS